MQIAKLPDYQAFEIPITTSESNAKVFAVQILFKVSVRYCTSHPNTKLFGAYRVQHNSPIATMRCGFLSIYSIIFKDCFSSLVETRSKWHGPQILKTKTRQESPTKRESFSFLDFHGHSQQENEDQPPEASVFFQGENLLTEDFPDFPPNFHFSLLL
ncbi:hypothetical protein VNO77_21778 [Canavalia gladiata]|uniref:Uncharacterized protein n=1 Tax=Canavalia gladiata TaxID=3824 RepID=A0AAN9L1C6_CANGL